MFDGESDHLDPDAAEVALRRAGFTVARPSALDQFRIAQQATVAGDDFIEAYVVATSDTAIDAVLDRINKIVHEFGGDCWEGGVEPLNYEPTFDDLFR